MAGLSPVCRAVAPRGGGTDWTGRPACRMSAGGAGRACDRFVRLRSVCAYPCSPEDDYRVPLGRRKWRELAGVMCLERNTFIQLQHER